MKPVYLDYNATTPLGKEVIAAMMPYLEEHFGNPSSDHYYGYEAKKAIQTARAQIASFLSCEREEIVITSGGSESNNYAIKGIAGALRESGNHIITSSVEHPAVLQVCEFLKKYGFDITLLPVDSKGMVLPEDVERAITPRTILITIMHANNEVGTIQPLEEISSIARTHNIIMHTDAAQSAGKIPVSVRDLGVDLLSIAAHKLYAPKGIGVLYVRNGVTLEKLVHGAGHEAGRRAGTENVPYIVGLGKACEISQADLDKNRARMSAMRDMLHEGLLERIKDIKLNGHSQLRLPNTLSLSFPGIEAHELISLTRENVAVSAGAACHSGETEISYVLKAMNVPPEWARGTVRFSTGRETTERDIKDVVEVVAGAVEKLVGARDSARRK